MLFELVNFAFCIFEGSEEVQRCLVGLVDFLFELKDVLCAIVEVLLQFLPRLLVVCLSLQRFGQLRFDVLLPGKLFLEGEELRFEAEDALLILILDIFQAGDRFVILVLLFVHRVFESLHFGFFCLPLVF